MFGADLDEGTDAGLFFSAFLFEIFNIFVNFSECMGPGKKKNKGMFRQLISTV